MQLIPSSNYAVLIGSGLTDGSINILNAANDRTVKGRTMLLKSMRFIPRYDDVSNTNKAIQFQAASGVATDDYNLVSPATPGNPRIITSNVEVGGIEIDFKYNGTKFDFIHSSGYNFPFDTYFDNMNVYFDQPLKKIELYINGKIAVDVTNSSIPVTRNFIMQVVCEVILDAHKFLDRDIIRLKHFGR